MPELAIVALTPCGQELGARIVQALGRGDVIVPRGELRKALTDLFGTGRPLVCIMALGIVVRILGPVARAKQVDPPVVVVDEAGRFAISVLGGHVGGANALAEQVANALGAVPVITTASDALGLPSLDLIGKPWNWKIEASEALTRVSAALVRGEPIGVYQDAGRRDWSDKWPASFQPIESWPNEGPWAGMLVISDRQLPIAAIPPAVVYRPPTLVLGVGCRRGVPGSNIDAMFEAVCRAQGVSPLSLGVVATATIKADEPGLIEFAVRRGVPLRSFSLEELGSVPDLPTPSTKVKEKLGIWGVAEPAALLASGSSRLLMGKERRERITMALARREDA
ncbi:MAG: cobalamin biosynthesis protein [Gemmataceae bacterium]|nr:cobalamin biosynthesis protein [Gemmataceae bacterium]